MPRRPGERGARRPRPGAGRSRPPPEEAEEGDFFPTGHDVGYHTAMEYRFVGPLPRAGPGDLWMRMRQPLVAGEEPTPLQRVLVAADSGNGISSTLDFRRYLFINVDLTVHLHRMPAGEWVCLDSLTIPEPTGDRARRHVAPRRARPDRTRRPEPADRAALTAPAPWDTAARAGTRSRGQARRRRRRVERRAEARQEAAARRAARARTAEAREPRGTRGPRGRSSSGQARRARPPKRGAAAMSASARRRRSTVPEGRAGRRRRSRRRRSRPRRPERARSSSARPGTHRSSSDRPDRHDAVEGRRSFVRPGREDRLAAPRHRPRRPARGARRARGHDRRRGSGHPGLMGTAYSYSPEVEATLLLASGPGRPSRGPAAIVLGDPGAGPSPTSSTTP